jgi:hypothetical protein
VITSRFWRNSQTNNSNCKNFWDGKGKAHKLTGKGFQQEFHSVVTPTLQKTEKKVERNRVKKCCYLLFATEFGLIFHSYSTFH